MSKCRGNPRLAAALASGVNPLPRRARASVMSLLVAGLCLLSLDAMAQSFISAPTQLQAYDTTSTQILLFWRDKSNNETGFKIERKMESAGTYAQIATVSTNATFYRDTGLITGTNYYYRIRASNALVDSAYSGEARAKPRLPKPGPPSQLRVTVVSTNQLDLFWRDTVTNGAGFKIERRDTVSSRYSSLTQVATGVTNYQDTGLEPETRYFYRVKATNSTGDSIPTSEVTAKTQSLFPSIPLAPTSLKATTGSTNSISLTWKDNSDSEDVFRIQRKTGTGGTYAEVALVGTNTVAYTDTGLQEVTEYVYRISSSNLAGDSEYSSEARATTTGTPLASGLLAGGYSHSLGLDENGDVWTWGANRYGMGDGTNLLRYLPVQITGLANVVTVASGRRSHSAALQSDGTVWMWGLNYNGQLGDGTTQNRMTPVQVSGLGAAADIAVGIAHTMALQTDGTVWVWGANSYGLGDGATISTNLPVQVTRLGSTVIQIASGGSHMAAVQSDGTVWSWGRNSFGQLGEGSVTTRLVPARTSGISGVTKLAAGMDFTLALKADGTVWSWGANTYGQLGDATTTAKGAPVFVSVLSTNVVAIAAGDQHALALKSDGTVWCWGANAFGQLGDGSSVARPVPVQASGASGIVAIGAGSQYSFAMKWDGTVLSWGVNTFGQLGSATNFTRRIPAAVTNLDLLPSR